MRLPQDTEDALTCCLDAAADPGAWGTALQRLGESLWAESCTIGSGSLRQLSALVMPVSTGHEEFRDIWLRNEPHAPDPHFDQRRWRRNKGSAVVLEHQLCTDDERRSLPYYNETARPAAREWQANSIFKIGGTSWWMAVYRGESKGPFTLDETPRLAIVGWRLAPIISLAEKFSAFQLNSTVLTLEQARCPAFIIDVRGKVVNMNRRAEGLLGEDFHLLQRRLVVRDPSSNLSLQRLVTRGISAPKGETLAPEPVGVCCDGELRYLIELIPMSTVTSAFFSAAKLLLLVTSLDTKAAPGESTLRQGFGLTSAEARLARLLALGNDLEEAAVQLNIRMPTARSHLQAIFGKTSTHRQAELTSLLARLS